jgi:hypothetical protein
LRTTTTSSGAGGGAAVSAQPHQTAILSGSPNNKAKRLVLMHGKIEA